MKAEKREGRERRDVAKAGLDPSRFMSWKLSPQYHSVKKRGLAEVLRSETSAVRLHY